MWKPFATRRNDRQIQNKIIIPSLEIMLVLRLLIQLHKLPYNEQEINEYQKNQQQISCCPLIT